MIKRRIDIDFSRKMGKVKPMSSVVGGPFFDFSCDLDFTDEYKAMSVPFVRTAPEPGRCASLDISVVFPDFSLDENLELSYDFTRADRTVLLSKATGADIFLCLTDGSDLREPIYKILPRENYEKWARVAAKIISHFNEGFALGHKLGIKYVEIMCGIDRSPIFEKNEDFFEFYRTVSNFLKKRFPRIKVGAYSSGGFRSLNHVDTREKEKGYVPFLEDFLSYISKKGTHAPLDFLSWECSCETPEELSLHTNYARSYLNHYGFKKTESIISEFNIFGAGERILVSDKRYPPLLASSLITAVKSDADMMFYKDMNPYAKGNFLYTVDDRTSKRHYSAYNVVRVFGEMAKGKSTLADTSEDYRHEIYSLASQNESNGYVMLVTRNFDGAIELNLASHSYTSYSIEGILGGGARGEGIARRSEIIPLSGKIALRTGADEVYFVTLYK